MYTLLAAQISGKLLMVEDESKTSEYLRQGLTEASFVVDLAANGLDGQHLAMNESYELIILDVMLPGCRWLAHSTDHPGRPVLFLTARDSVADRVKGLELGADDYLVKPFAFSELLARVRTLLRRGTVQLAIDRIQVGDLVLDLARRRASRAGRP
ncbi:response regulator [Cupriavidus sp. Agwp_2]|uniref:response regulator n=1 Tax=Cupriavidus sp. Agwp_2 TaxID=2897324 RepID=UPI0034610AC6